MKLVILKRVEWIVAIVLSAVVLFLFLARVKSAGALWRDECDSLQLARMSRLADVIENLPYTSFPVFFLATIRAHTAVFGTSDLSLRCFGLGMGIAFISAAWLQTRTLNNEVPLALLALIGLNSTFLTVGILIRGYGLGSVLVILAFTLTARLLLQPTAMRLTGAVIAYLASMQCLFFNGVLIPVIVLAAIAVWFFRGRPKWMLALLGVAALCGISYIPYLLGLLGIKEWTVVLKSPISFALAWHQVMLAFGEPNSVMPGVWFVLLFLSVIGATWRLIIIWRRKPAPESDLLLFALLTIPISTAVYFAFLQFLVNAPHPRYYLTLVCLLAAAADLIIANLSRFFWIRVARMTLIIVAVIVLPFAAWPQITKRQTNVDVVAQRVTKEARPNDLIVVNPWVVGVSFNWYYHGPNRWITVPEMNEHRVQRHDLLKQKMTEVGPLADVEQEMTAALKSGNRVWIVGDVEKSRFGRSRLALSPAPDPKFGWQARVYRDAWSQEVGHFIRSHAVRVAVVMTRGKMVSAQENVPLWSAEGWRD